MRTRRRHSKPIQVLGALVIVALVYSLRLAGWLPGAGVGEADVLDAFRTGQSGVWVEAAGRVVRSLPDDTEGDRHQKFLVELSSGHTLLVSHNIDLADRVPLEQRDRVAVRGKYEWNDRGGLVHWTHRDPNGRRAGGWIEHEGARYD